MLDDGHGTDHILLLVLHEKGTVKIAVEKKGKHCGDESCGHGACRIEPYVCKGGTDHSSLSYQVKVH